MSTKVTPGTRARPSNPTGQGRGHGGPVKTNRIYDLLEMSGGVPIDTSEVDTLSVYFKSPYPKGEKAVIEAFFSEYLGVEIEIEDMIARAPPMHIENRQEDAVVDSD